MSDSAANLFAVSGSKELTDEMAFLISTRDGLRSIADADQIAASEWAFTFAVGVWKFSGSTGDRRQMPGALISVESIIYLIPVCSPRPVRRQRQPSARPGTGPASAS